MHTLLFLNKFENKKISNRNYQQKGERFSNQINFFQIRTRFDQINDQIRQLNKTVILDKTPSSVFVDEGSKSGDRLEERMSVCAEKSRETYRLFKKQKHSKS